MRVSTQRGLTAAIRVQPDPSLTKISFQFADAFDRDGHPVDGSFIAPTPSDVPQQIKSPGQSVMSWDILLTSCCALKIISEIG